MDLERSSTNSLFSSNSKIGSEENISFETQSLLLKVQTETQDTLNKVQERLGKIND
jgi:hypothetical protein